MTTDHQRALLEEEDWRYHAIGPVGSTGIGSISTTEKFREKIVSFGLPSASALYPSAERNAHMRRAAIDLSSVFVPHLQGTWSEDHSPLFDYFESFASEVIFSFTALEAFANEVISADFTYKFKSNMKSGTVPLSKAEIERQVSLDEKLKSVLPQAHNIKSPNGTRPWQNYKELKDVRNRLIHLKSIARKTSGPEHQTFWGLMLKEQNSVFPDMTARKIRHFETLVKDRR